MNNKYILFVIIAIVAGAITYIALDNIFVSIGVVAIYLITGILLFVPMIKKHSSVVRRFHECYHFINNFIIALSIKKSIKGSLESTVASMPTGFIDIYEGLENMSDEDRLHYLSSYFPFYVYRLFLQIITIWEEEGGDILQMSKYLITETRNNEEYISKADTMANHKYVEIGVLWGFCAAIVIVLRFALKEFYTYIKGQLIFIISIAVLMVFILFSIYLLIQKGTNLKIKGADSNEKVA